MLTPNETYFINGVKVNEKIIPDGTVWTNDEKAKKAGFSGAGALYKAQKKLSGNTGIVQSVTIHNTGDIASVEDDAEQYTRATYNQNMLSARVHFYVDELGAWQNLRAGTGMCENDPNGTAEVSWHAGDGSTKTGGNQTSLSIEIIMNSSSTQEENIIAKDNGARLAAWLLWKHELNIDNLVTHTYWVNKTAGNTFSNIDCQCANYVSGKKWCPEYILGEKSVAYKNWMAFKQEVQRYLNHLRQYRVKVLTRCTNIRSGPGTNFAITGTLCRTCICCIIENYTDSTGKEWGRLKDGRGWIILADVEIL